MLDWITIAWSMVGATCLTFGLLHLYIWLRRPKRLEYLFYSMTALAAAAFAMVELSLMTSESVEHYKTAVRWAHVPGFVLMVSLPLFIRVYLNAGRWWLLLTRQQTKLHTGCSDG